MGDVFRLDPRLPPQHRKTYAIRSPVTTHTRVAACDEVACAAHEHGWTTFVDDNTDLGRRQAHYIRNDDSRHSIEERDERGVTFTFPAGQECFAEHRVPLHRPPLFLVTDGDHRGNPRGTPTRMHATGEHWVEDFSEHQERLKRAQE